MANLRQYKADITCLAKSWEELVSIIEYPTRKFALLALLELVESYLRGKGIRMRSYSGFEKYGIQLLTIETEVIERIMCDEAKEIWFPTLTKIGFTDFDNVTELIKSATRSKYG